MAPKTRLFWPGLFLLSSGWHLLLPVFTAPTFIGLLLLLAGTALMGFSFLDGAPEPPARSVLWYLVAAVAVACLAPYPYRLGGLVLLGGLLLLVLLSPAGVMYRVGFGIVLAGLISVLQSAVIALSLQLPVHRLDGLAPLIASLFRFFDCNAFADGNSVFVQAQTGIREYAVSAEYFGLLFLLQSALGALVWLQLGALRRPWRHFLLFVALAAAYAVARFFLLALLFLELGTFRIFWNPWVFLASFLPFYAGLSAAPLATTMPRRVSATGQSTRRQTVPALAFASAAALLVLAWAWDHPGKAKGGRLLIDENHSAWERLNRPYDTEWYGEESGYNYYCLDQFLGHYYTVRHNSARITAELLADCDILLIKTPTSAFTAEEVAAIEAFVRRGGGLLLIGDHTNVFGTSTYLNALARRFGLRFNADATYDLATGGLSFYEKPKLLAHPVVQRLPPFLFATSCTLDVAFSAALPIAGYSLRVAGHDYSTPSFFSPRTDGPHVTFGVFPQLAAVKFQRGRVVAFTDSTVFSNFWMFIAGKPELLLGCTEWLNRENGVFSSWAAAALALGLAGAGLFRLRKDLAGFFPLALAAGAIGFLAGAHLAGVCNRVQYPVPTPHTPCPTICFERQYSSFELPDKTLIHEPDADFHTFYTWVQRVGYVPRACGKLDDALAGRGLAMLNPIHPLPPRRLQRLHDYVENGGVLFLFGSPEQLQPAIDVLRLFGLGLTNTPAPRQWLADGAGEIVATNRTAVLAVGGQPVLFTDKHEPVLAVQPYGKGVVIFGGDAGLFANSSLGTTSIVPDERQKRLFKIIFNLFRQLEATPSAGSRD